MTTLDDSFILSRNDSIDVLAMRGFADKIYVMGKSKKNVKKKMFYSETYDAGSRELISKNYFPFIGNEKDYIVSTVIPGVFSFLAFAGHAIYCLETKHSLVDKPDFYSFSLGTIGVIFGIPALISLTLGAIYHRGEPKRDKLRKKQEVFYKKLELLKKLT